MKKIVGAVALMGLLFFTAWSAFASSQKSMVGQQLPDLTIDFLKDKPDLKGKPLIVEFWATWCPPCRKSIPHLNEVYKKYKDKGLEIVGISNEDSAKVGEFTKSVPIDYHVGLDKGGQYGSAFNIEGIPHAVLVDKSGKIVWEGHPMALKDADIEKILK